VLLTAGVSVCAASLGALGAVRRAVRLPPAEAMRPEAPADFRPGPVEKLGIGVLLPASARMILRNLERQPLRAMAAGTGVALSVSILVVGLFFVDAVRFMIDLQFREAQREDLSIAFVAPRPQSVRHELAALEGVLRVETFRAVPAHIHHEQRHRTLVITGVPAGGELRRIITQARRIQPLPEQGLVLNSRLAQVLGIVPGDSVRLEVLQGARAERMVPVAGLVDEMFGLGAYMPDHALHSLLGEAPAASGAHLRVDAAHREALYEQLKRLPAVASVQSPTLLVESFEELLGQNLWISIGFLAVLAGILAVGVIYNGARIALSERGRELASLRVLGFSRREVAVLLLGEQAVVTLLAIPFGWVIGYGFGALVLAALESDTYRIPLVVSGQTYLFAAGVAVLAALFAGLLVRRRLDRLDLIEVLKTRE
jgi:putative ABC transport system permease protein